MASSACWPPAARPTTPSIWWRSRVPPASSSTGTTFSDLSAVVPLLARVYPNGKADVNHFHAAGGMGFVIGELLDAGLLHDDVTTVAGAGLCALSRGTVLCRTAGSPGARRRKSAASQRAAHRSRDRLAPTAD